MLSVNEETRVALIHRVLVPNEESPREYAILVTDKRSIFIRQGKTRSSFVLRGEMRYGTALVTDVVPKTLEDYEDSNLESLASDPENLTVSHTSIQSLLLKKNVPKFRFLDLWIWLTMRRQHGIFQVYHFELNYLKSPEKRSQIKFYLVPLGAYFKPRRQTQSRETILEEYADEALKLYQHVLPSGVVSRSEQLTEKKVDL